jgi:hypothetical protein
VPLLGPYEYLGQQAAAGIFAEENWQGTLTLTGATHDQIVGTWSVPGFTLASVRGQWSVDAYHVTVNPESGGRIVHRLVPHAPGNLECQGSRFPTPGSEENGVGFGCWVTFRGTLPPP